jgi:hypothetical protein
LKEPFDSCFRNIRSTCPKTALLEQQSHHASQLCTYNPRPGAKIRLSNEPDYDRDVCYGAAEMPAPDIEPKELNAGDTMTLVSEIL